MSNRRDFLANSSRAVASALVPAGPSASGSVRQPCDTIEIVSLCGEWLFRIDPNNLGTKQNWHGSSVVGEGWRRVAVPHTWQVETALAGYRGVAWYQRSFDVPLGWQEGAVRVEFEAVFHSTTIWVNGVLVGEHARKGYTAFTLDITQALHWDQRIHPKHGREILERQGFVPHQQRRNFPDSCG